MTIVRTLVRTSAVSDCFMVFKKWPIWIEIAQLSNVSHEHCTCFFLFVQKVFGWQISAPDQIDT